MHHWLRKDALIFYLFRDSCGYWVRDLMFDLRIGLWLFIDLRVCIHDWDWCWSISCIPFDWSDMDRDVAWQLIEILWMFIRMIHWYWLWIIVQPALHFDLGFCVRALQVTRFILLWYVYICILIGSYSNDCSCNWTADHRCVRTL